MIIRKYELLYQIDKRKTRFLSSLAYRLPMWLKYWVVIDMACKVSLKHPNKVVPEITWDDMCKLVDD